MEIWRGGWGCVAGGTGGDLPSVECYSIICGCPSLGLYNDVREEQYLVEKSNRTNKRSMAKSSTAKSGRFLRSHSRGAHGNWRRLASFLLLHSCSASLGLDWRPMSHRHGAKLVPWFSLVFSVIPRSHECLFSWYVCDFHSVAYWPFLWILSYFTS